MASVIADQQVPVRNTTRCAVAIRAGLWTKTLQAMAAGKSQKEKENDAPEKAAQSVTH